MSDFYDRLDEHERKSRIDRLIANRPENLHDYQGCANDAAKQSASAAQPVESSREEVITGPRCGGCGHFANEHNDGYAGCTMRESDGSQCICGEFRAPTVEAQREEEPLPLEACLCDDVGCDLCPIHKTHCIECGQRLVPTPPPSDMPEPLVSEGAALIAAERQRQVESEGWTPEHDDEHDLGEMTIAAWCYAEHAVNQERGYANRPRQSWWPWSARWWKPSPDPIRNLVKAGALIAAEIDRLQRKAAATHE